MPFTLAHPFVILPLAERLRFVPLSALIVGSMAPDFPYFLMIHSNYYHVGHSPLGILTFCLPTGLIVLAIYHYLLKFPLLALLPENQSNRLYKTALAFSPRTILELFWILAGLIFGAVSHLVLDSFTHINGGSVRRLPFLAYPFPIYKGLQYGLSVFGLWIIYAAYRKWLRKSTPFEGTKRLIQPVLTLRQVTHLLLGIALLSCIFGVAYSAKEYRVSHGHERRKKIFADALESGMTASFIGTCLYSFAWHVAHRRMRSPVESEQALSDD